MEQNNMKSKTNLDKKSSTRLYDSETSENARNNAGSSTEKIGLQANEIDRTWPEEKKKPENVETVPVEQFQYESTREESPFTIVGSLEKGYKIVMGNQQISQKTFASIEEANIYVESKPWELIIVGCMVFRDSIIKYNKKK